MWYFWDFSLKTISLWVFLTAHITIVTQHLFTTVSFAAINLKKDQTYMWFEPKRGLDGKRKINASVFEACLQQSARRSAYLYRCPINDTASTKVPQLGYHSSFNLPNPDPPEPPERNTSTRCCQRHDVRVHKVKGQQGRWPNLIASLSPKQKRITYISPSFVC